MGVHRLPGTETRQVSSLSRFCVRLSGHLWNSDLAEPGGDREAAGRSLTEKLIGLLLDRLQRGAGQRVIPFSGLLTRGLHPNPAR